MITLSIVESRMRRQKITSTEGQHYVHKDDLLDKIPYLSQFNEEQFLFGIYDSSFKWTVMSVTTLFANYNGKPFTLRLDKDSDKIHKYFAKDGHKHKSDAILDDGKRIWMKSSAMSCTFQNMMLMLQVYPYGTRLEP